MADDDSLSQFTSITGAEPERALQYLSVADHNVEQAIQLYFESGGIDLGGALPAQNAPSPHNHDAASSSNPIPIEDDHDMDVPSVEDDAAMAQRLQNEMYSSVGGGGVQDDIDPDTGVRAPMARTTETLAGPGADWGSDPEEMRAAIAEQMMNRRQRRAQGRPGIFNQQTPASSSSVWDPSAPDSTDAPTRRHNLSVATGGASESSSKSSLLAELYRPPFELISPRLTWEAVRAQGKEEEKWILINIQDPNIFDCQILNRDIWKDERIQDTVRESFVFKQYAKHDTQAGEYIRFYFPTVDSEDAYPHIAILDPRTGERMKVWSGPPTPKPGEFLMQLHEFLDRYSLHANAKNPVAKRKPDPGKKKEVAKMSEDEMMAAAVAESLGEGGASDDVDNDPDALTRSTTLPTAPPNGHPPSQPAPSLSAFARIAATPHEEPPQGDGVTRIQFRHPSGRIIRRFMLDDAVVRLFEWLKAEPLEGMEGKEFELVALGRNLVEAVEQGETVGQAGLKNGTVMVEFGGV